MRKSRAVGQTGGFTLIELLVVIAIIAVLAAVLVPVFTLAKRNAKCSCCQSNLRQLSAATSMYVQENGGRFPPQPEDGVADWKLDSAKPNWARSLEHYVKLSRIPACPGASQLSDCRTNCSMAVTGISYPISYFGNGQIFRNGIAESAITRSSKTVAFQCCGRVWNKCWVAPTWNEEYSQWESHVSRSWCVHDEGTNLAFADGHIRWMKFETISTNLALFEPTK